jgi:hypothetical protein
MRYVRVESASEDHLPIMLPVVAVRMINAVYSNVHGCYFSSLTPEQLVSVPGAYIQR